MLDAIQENAIHGFRTPLLAGAEHQVHVAVVFFLEATLAVVRLGRLRMETKPSHR
jgi:hypothetical protein